MGIQQKNSSFSIWVQTLLNAIESNFAVDRRNFRSDTYFEEGETVAKAFFYKIMLEKFGEEEAISQFHKLWPETSNREFVIERSKVYMAGFRYGTVKTGLIKNYFKFKKVNYDSISKHP